MLIEIKAFLARFRSLANIFFLGAKIAPESIYSKSYDYPFIIIIRSGSTPTLDLRSAFKSRVDIGTRRVIMCGGVWMWCTYMRWW